MSNYGCTLCGTKIIDPIVENERFFCCMGCHSVFQILYYQGVISFHDHPLFQQAVSSGLISNPNLSEQLQKKTIEQNIEYEKLVIEIENMWCPSCAEVIRWILLREPGVKLCSVDYATDLASIEYSPRYLAKERIFQLIQKLGYQVSYLESPEKKKVQFSLILRLSMASFCALNIMMFSYPVYASYFSDDSGYAPLFAWISFAFSLPCISYCSWPIMQRCLSALSLGIIGMELLVTLGITAAFTLSMYQLYCGSLHIYFDSMSVIIAFVLLGKIIESKAKFTAKDSLLGIARTLPKRGRKKFTDGSSLFVPIKEIKKGDHLLIFTGEKVVLDGTIVEGEAMIEETAMTGEAMAVQRKINHRVLAGSIIVQGWICIKVGAQLEETTLHKIVEMIGHDLHHKTPYIRWADKIVRWFVPLIIFIAIGTSLTCWLWGVDTEQALIRAMTILLIACPCAIGIAAPLAESHLMYALASLGAIIRNRGVLRLLGEETAFVFDKTGTITQGKFRMINEISLDQHSLSILKAMTSHSIHPISVAISESLKIKASPLDSVKEYPGLGIEASFQKQTYRLGSEKFIMFLGKDSLDFADRADSLNNYSLVYFSDGKKVAPIILGDMLKTHAIDTVQSCKPALTYLVSGDGIQTVKSVAKACGFDECLWRQTPLQKREIVVQLKQKGHLVGMLGDGINDSPALAAADISFSVVNATDISIQVSDILLTTECLNVLPEIRKLARKGQRIVKQNLFWAFAYNSVGIVLGMFGYLSPIFSAFAMMSSSIIVICNSRRIM